MNRVFLYDGDCGFCTRSALLLRRHASPAVRIVAWQTTDLTPLGVTDAQCASAVQHVAGNRVSSGPFAIADALRDAPELPWRLAGRLLGLRPVAWIAWPLYRLVARNRHRLPGGTAACALQPGRSTVT